MGGGIKGCSELFQKFIRFGFVPYTQNNFIHINVIVISPLAFSVDVCVMQRRQKTDNAKVTSCIIEAECFLTVKTFKPLSTLSSPCFPGVS